MARERERERERKGARARVRDKERDRDREREVHMHRRPSVVGDQVQGSASWFTVQGIWLRVYVYGDEVWVSWDSDWRAQGSGIGHSEGIDPTADKHTRVSVSAQNVWLCVIASCEELWLFVL